MTLRTMYDCVYVSRSRSTGAHLKANEEEEVVMDSMSGGLIRQRGIFLFFIFIFFFFLAFGAGKPTQETTTTR